MRRRVLTGFSCSTLLAAGLAVPPAFAVAQPFPVSGFAVLEEVMVPGTPLEAWYAFTGDLLPWWDHTFSAKPTELVLEPRTGGRFFERFDDAGNGALHATVHFVEIGKRLRFTGPLGLSGKGISMVHTVTFEAQGDSTQVKVECRGFGEYESGWEKAVEGVWRHFLAERFKPYVESGRHRAKRPWKP
jgi:hypothetical protein